MRVEELGPADAGRWDAFVARTPGASIYHLHGWHALIRELFGHASAPLAALDERGTIRGVLPVVRLKSALFGNFAVSMPYFNYGGALAVEPEVRARLADAAVERARDWGCTHLELRSTLPGECTLPTRTDKVCMELALPESEEALWKRFEPKLRAQIRRPTKEGAVATSGGIELLPEFYDVFARNMRDLGTPVYGRDFFERICRDFAAHVTLVVVRLGGRAVAAGFLLRWGDRVEIPWASSLREFNRTGANMLLYWESLRLAIAGGARRFDFGRSSIDAGTYRFKRQWGAEPVQLHWYYWLRDSRELPNLSPSNAKYRLAIGAWQRLPLGVTTWLGPRIVRNLP